MRRLVLLSLLTLLAFLGVARLAFAVESYRVPPDAQAIDLTNKVERNFSQGDRLQVSTAPDAGGIVRRIEVSAKEAGTQPAWIVFALTNDTDEQIERLLVAPHFRLVGSGVISPDLGATRISAITASQGFPPESEESEDADIFRLTLDPGTTVTYVAELRTPSLPQLYLWEPDAYKDKQASLTLFKGIVIGVAGLLALFLTIVFVVKGGVIFPAAAALATAVLVYVCIDFGFWGKLIGAAGAGDQVWRASAETFLAATLSVFLFAYLNLASWHVRASYVVAGWLALLCCLVGLAIYDPATAAGVARISLATVAVVGIGAAAFEEVREQKEFLSATAYKEMFDGHRADVQAGKYRTFGEGWDAVMGRPDGSGGELFLLSLLRTEHPEATIDDAKRLKLFHDDQLTLALDEVSPAFFQVLAEDEKVPPAARPGVVLAMKENWERVKLKRAGLALPSS